MSDTGPNGEIPEQLAEEAKSTATNDAVAGETVEGTTPYKEAQPTMSENDLTGENIDLDDEESDGSGI